MSHNFWRGLLWGGVIGTVITAMARPLVRPQYKFSNRRGEELWRGARKVSRRLMKKLG